MDVSTLDQVIRQTCESPVIRKLDELALETAGVGLFVFWSLNRDQSKETCIAGSNRTLPEFCRIFHSVPEGRSRCMLCHSLLAMSAQNGATLKENVCHGGASVLMALVRGEGLPEGVEILVVSTCAFSLKDRQRGWRMARVRAGDMDLDLGKLRKAYKQLPELTGARLKAAQMVIDAAAAAVAEGIRRGLDALPHVKSSAAEPVSPATAEERLRSALRLAHEAPLRRVGRPSGATLVDVIKTLVTANPQMRISEADIARISRVTPNYFSTLFHKFAGKTFLEFLIEKRLELAKTLLRDLTLSISEIANRVGFADPGYFAKVFHKHTGKTPGEWRRRL